MAGLDSYTKLLLHCDGADGSTVFTDESDSAHPITANGNAQIDTAYKKFGTGALLLDGVGDYLSVPDHDDWDFETGDWTIDFWLRFNNYATTTFPTMFNSGDTDGVWIFYNNNAAALEIQVIGSYVQNAWSPANGTWYHVAAVRKGNAVKSFIDGNQIGSDFDVSGKDITGLTSGLKLGIDSLLISSYALDGWMDEIRVSNIARWTSNFTPPARAYSRTVVRGRALIW